MSFYIAGVFVGRFLASYLIVLCILFLVSKFKARKAFTRSTKWYGWIFTFIVFVLGVSASAVT